MAIPAKDSMTSSTMTAASCASNGTGRRRVIVTNAYHKHSQKMTKLDLEALEVAARCRADYLRRVQEGGYYEG